MAKPIPTRRPSRLIPEPPRSGRLPGVANEIIIQPPADTTTRRVVEPRKPTQSDTRGGGAHS
jgi:hypothetical protein